MKIQRAKKSLQDIREHIDRDTYVDQLGLVASLEVVEDRGLIEVGQVGHVLALLKLGRVHLHAK